MEMSRREQLKGLFCEVFRQGLRDNTLIFLLKKVLSPQPGFGLMGNVHFLFRLDGATED